MPTEFIKYQERDFNTAKKNFLFFASGTQVLKGLDLLLDAFSKRTDYNLIICSNVLKEKEFVTFFHNYLFERKNIRTIGFVDINSELFASITKECAFVIHPTCSEGSVGSVIQCMRTGLIPVVTLISGIDIDESGYFIEDIRINKIIELTRQTFTGR